MQLHTVQLFRSVYHSLLLDTKIILLRKLSQTSSTYSVLLGWKCVRGCRTTALLSVETSTRNISSCVLGTCVCVTNSSAFMFPLYILKRLLRRHDVKGNWFCYFVYCNGGTCGHEAHERWVVGSCIQLEGWVYIVPCIEAVSSPNACYWTAQWFLVPEVWNTKFWLGKGHGASFKRNNVIFVSRINGELLYGRLFLIIQHLLFCRSKHQNLQRLIKLC